VFGRRKSNDSGAGIVEFWVWWDQARHRVAAAIDDKSIPSLTDEISKRVKAIHDDLHWELSPGRSAKHALVVAPAGDARLRATLARWLAAAPPADDTFEYFGSRQADNGFLTARMQFAGQELDMSGLRFGFTMEDDAHCIDVTVFHPGMAAMPEQARLQLTFLALDWTVGEEQVEVWIGAVEPQLRPSPNLHTAAELNAAVAELATKHAKPVYVLLGAETKRGPLMVTVQVPLRSARWPRFDTHVAATAKFPAQNTGLPTDGSLTRLRDLEDRIEAALGADGVVIGHETCAGVRTIHVYVDGVTQAADAVAGAARSGPLGAKTGVTYDPAFERVRHLRP
jgi:hypothetical protein